MESAGPVAVGGMLLVGCGYNFAKGDMPGTSSSRSARNNGVANKKKGDGINRRPEGTPARLPVKTVVKTGIRNR